MTKLAIFGQAGGVFVTTNLISGLDTLLSDNSLDCDILNCNISFDYSEDNLDLVSLFSGSILFGEDASDAELMATSYTSTDGDWNYTFVDESKGTIEITGYNGSENGAIDVNGEGSPLSIPSTIDGYKVTIIGDEAFNGGLVIYNIEIPEGVTSIGEYAFYSQMWLESIKLPESLKSIGEYAFFCCFDLTSIEMSENVTSIGKYAFSGCKGLTSIKIPASVTSIGESAFSLCENLKKITVDSDNKKYSSKNGVLYNKKKTKLIYCPEGKSGSFNVPSGVKSIEDYAFYAGSITSVKLSDSVTSIGELAFFDCTSLKKVTIGKNVKTIGACAFENCKKLTKVTIPSKVTSIGEAAFFGCTALKTLAIGKNVKTIGAGAFSGCTSLKKVTIPGEVTSIGKYAFMNCTALKTLTIGKSVKKIGAKAFYNCKKLSTVTIKSKKLTSSKVGSKAFSKTKSTVKIKVPKAKKSAYKKLLIKKGVSKKATISAS